jgi:hypothetical protein
MKLKEDHLIQWLFLEPTIPFVHKGEASLQDPVGNETFCSNFAISGS